MILGIDASNIRGGGGITHLTELLNVYDSQKYSFTKIIVWSGKSTLNRLPNYSWLEKRTHRFLDWNVFFRLFWQIFLAKHVIPKSKIDLLFVPGALYYVSFSPLVSMSQSMLPFEDREIARYGFSYMKIRLKLLQKKQAKGFVDADGVIFLAQYAKNSIGKQLNGEMKSTAIVPYGLSSHFIEEPKAQRDISSCRPNDPFELLYVSTIDVYKHQKNLVPVVVRLFNEGFNVSLKIVGPSYEPELVLLKSAIQKHDPEGKVINFVGEVPYSKLKAVYQGADLFVFASSCENLPNILVEAMASGLPIACSNMGPMPDVLKDGGLYFNPENQEDIYTCLREMISNKALREEFAKRSNVYARDYSWQKCAHQTFNYLSSFVK